MSSFVFENIEVIMTGRKASRVLSSNKCETLVEITPKNDKDGLWHKWVPERVLFVVEELSTQGEDDEQL